jgi:Xaa-Pro dipeptidase
MGDQEGVVLLQGGKLQHRYDTDKEELFRQESHFHYLFGVKEAGCWGAIRLADRKAVLFIPRLHPDYAIWDGRIKPPSEFAEEYELDQAFFVDEIKRVILEEWKEKVVHILSGINSDSKRSFAEAELESVLGDSVCELVVRRDVLLLRMAEARLIKNELEIQILRYVNLISSNAHRYVMRRVKPGMKEYQLESLFLHYCSYRMHAREVPYHCICCTGENGAVLHYGGDQCPLTACIEDGDMCLLDMGSEHHCYVSDITCSFPANGKFSPIQKEVYLAVYRAQRAVEAAICPGVEWIDMHKLAERVLIENLREFGFLNKEYSAEELFENRISAYFMPHGLGHLMGLDVHDVGGYPPGRERVPLPSLKYVRVNRTLQEGMVLTNEPGVYFIRNLIGPALKDPSVSKFFNVEKISSVLASRFGGVRLEDDVVVTKTGCETLTKVPRSIEDVEAEMKLPAPLIE